jgi:hypothetical protein
MLGGLPAARAQVTTEQQFDSIYLLPARGVRLPAANETSADVLASRARYGNERLSFSLTGSSTLSRFSLIEMPGEVIPGRYTRPKYAFGFRSNTMKSLAKDVGLDADTCLLPLVRARVSFSQDEGAGGRVMVFARCTFH